MILRYFTLPPSLPRIASSRANAPSLPERSAFMMPTEDSGSQLETASPTATQHGPDAASRQWDRAGQATTRSAVSALSARTAVNGAARNCASQGPSRELDV